MFDGSTKIGVIVLATLTILSGVRILVDHFAAGSAIGGFLGKIVDFMSANVKH